MMSKHTAVQLGSVLCNKLPHSSGPSMSATEAWGHVSWGILSNMGGEVRLEWILGRGDEKGSLRQNTTM